MTNYAAACKTLYALPGASWDDVALWCNTQGRKYTGAYYCKIANGKTGRLSAKVKRGIDLAAVQRLGYDLTTVKRALKPRDRLGLSIRHLLAASINGWRNSHEMSWDQWHEKAHELMVKELGK